MCSDCQVPLVAELPPDPKPQLELELVTVFASGDLAITGMAESLLEDAGIDYVSKNEGLQDLFPTEAFEIQIQVQRKDENEAKELLKGLQAEGQPEA